MSLREALQAANRGYACTLCLSNGEVIAHAIYDPWGNPTAGTERDVNFAGIDNVSNYTGYTWDDVLGLYFAQNRFYDAENHRFTQDDPARDGANWYVYCWNNPGIWVDPDGYYIILEGTKKERKDLLDCLQQLTDDVLDVKWETLPNNKNLLKYVVKIKTKKTGSFPLGTALIRELCEPDFYVTLQIGYHTVVDENGNSVSKTNGSVPRKKNGKSMSGKSGAEVDIYLDFNIDLYFLSMVNDSAIMPILTPDFITMGHELIHAYNYVKGIIDPYDEPKPVGLSISRYSSKYGDYAIIYYHSASELLTTGLSYYPVLLCEDGTYKLGELVTFDALKYTENALRMEHGLPLRIVYDSTGEDTKVIPWKDAMKLYPGFKLPSYTK